ncbi:uncharacterized protein LOC142765479 isoform X2 [Rhipicephalus microplus]|uniref:uncharacterized protein LOC142765479 isoform X2 n=1 Tax=Rhipicephalus microplus TaxID=6941 RepID=UPI003F6C8E05
MWRGSIHDSLIWKDCDVLRSFEGTKLPNGWLQGRSISIRQDTGVNNNGNHTDLPRFVQTPSCPKRNRPTWKHRFSSLRRGNSGFPNSSDLTALEL